MGRGREGGYNQHITIFSSKGHVFQKECAFKAAGVTSIGVLGKNLMCCNLEEDSRTTPSEEEPLPETCNATKDDEPSLDDSTCCVLQDGGPSQEDFQSSSWKRFEVNYCGAGDGSD